MIQRLQSVFLFLSSGALAGSFALPFASSDDKTSHAYFADGIFNIHDNTVLMALIIGTIVLGLVTIFLFNNRKLQLNLCLLDFGLIGAVIGMLIVPFITSKAISPAIGIGCPILGLVFAILAFVYIRKDDKLVKSMDRLR